MTAADSTRRGNRPGQPLRRLAYLSRRNPAVTDEQVVDGIVMPAIVRNRSLGVTGCLWFSDRYFFQVLEGPPEAIDRLMASIRADTRHRDIAVMLDQPIEDRRFVRFGLRAVDSQAAGSMPSLIEALGLEQPEAPHPRRGLVGRLLGLIEPTEDRPEGHAVEGQHAARIARLVHSVIDELAGWSDASPT
ncbi:MAG: hypothetical protein KatS3mg103_0560 [Phycisphaerales bacterium]|nr:MAG: hypothetical protein KatS3mg103_0560 [Phycisphaerales bacterium]